MKTKYKFLFLIFTACVSSILIYYFCEKSQPVSYRQDLISYQNKVDETELMDTNYTINDPKIIVNPYGISPLTALVIFETRDLTTPRVTVLGKTTNANITSTFKPNKVHYLPIYGLYPGEENSVIINVNNKDYVIHIKTDPLPEDFVKPTSVTSSDNLNGNELYFVTPSSKGYTSAYDINGDVRWYLDDYFLWEISTLKNGNLMFLSLILTP